MARDCGGVSLELGVGFDAGLRKFGRGGKIRSLRTLVLLEDCLLLGIGEHE